MLESGELVGRGVARFADRRNTHSSSHAVARKNGLDPLLPAGAAACGFSNVTSVPYR